MKGCGLVRVTALVLALLPSGWPPPTHAESNARIELRVTHNGEPTRARVVVLDPESGTTLAEAGVAPGAGATRLSVRPGVASLHVRALELHGEVDRFFDEVRLAPGDEVRLEHDFVTGVLNLRATLRSEPVDARVEVQDEKGQTVARFTTRGDDRDLPLTPGTYRVVVAPLRGPEDDARAARVVIEPRGIEVIDVELRPGLPRPPEPSPELPQAPR
ncbi:MAG: hypothetical protein QNK05_07090 [Myxococcota bacterium]|nr:hypothetical protein [Myxococcota bacterium]